MKKIIIPILTFLNLLSILALLVAYLSVFISPEYFWPLSFFGLAYPLLLAINLFFVLLWLLINPRYLWGSLIAISIGAGFFSRFIQLKGRSLEKADIEILSYNVNHFAGNEQKQQKETALEITSFFKKLQPDIICLQEVRLRKNSIFNLPETVHELNFINHYQFARSSNTFGSVTLTRYPIVNMNEIRFENSRNITIYTDVMIDSDTVRIFNVHLHSYGIDPRAYSIIGSGVVSSENDLKEVREVGSKLRTGFEMRARQAKIIKKHIDDSPYHVIVCGDLNDTPFSYSYRKLKKGMKDAFISSGSGVGRTYIGKLPSFRIDYIFHSSGFDSFNFKTHNFRQSDHLPVSCSLVKNIINSS